MRAKSPVIDIAGEVFQTGLGALREQLRKVLEPAPFQLQLKEYELIKLLSKQGAFDFCPAHTPGLQLYYKHFLTTHCLHQLQAEFVVQNRYLVISPIGVEFHPLNEVASGQALTEELPALRDYYLDLNHLAKATENSVQNLLRDFWARFNAVDALQAACDTLGVKPDDDWRHIETTFRRAIARAHPDKGGSAEQFITLRGAFDTLKQAGRR